MDAGELFCGEIREWAGDDDDTDALLVAASQEFELRTTTATPTSSAPAPPAARQQTTTSTTHQQQSGSSALRFAPPQTEEQIERARIDGIPDSTKRDTQYCLKIWGEWSKERGGDTHSPPIPYNNASITTIILACSVCPRGTKKKRRTISTELSTSHSNGIGQVHEVQWKMY